MSKKYEIPLKAYPAQFAVALANATYTFITKWNALDNVWVLDIYDATNTTPVLTGIALVTGVDLFAQFGYLNFGGTLTVATDGAQSTLLPTKTNLGTLSHLYYTTP